METRPSWYGASNISRLRTQEESQSHNFAACYIAPTMLYLSSPNNSEA